jgi:aspartate/methionine/tyrosine aminotransferase
MATTNTDRSAPLATPPQGAASVSRRGAPLHHPAAAARLAVLGGEGALDVLARAAVLESQGRNIAQLAIGEPQFAVAPHIVEAAVQALRDGDARYGPPAGIAALRGAIAATLGSRQVEASADDVIVTPGAKPMLLYAFLATVEPGAEVLIPDPGFPIYPSLTRFCGATSIGYRLDPARGFAPDVADIAAHITPRTRVLLLNAPHNPTGGSIDARTLEEIANLVLRHDLLVISDEIYGRITFDGEATPSIAALPGLRDRTIVVDGFSKAYAMTGYRLGYGLVPRWLVERLTTLVVNGHTCTPPFIQRAGIAALTGPQDAVQSMVTELRRRRDEVVTTLRAIPGVRCATPTGAFYAFPDVSELIAASGLTAPQLADRLLEEHGVALLPGKGFGAAGVSHFRISFAGTADAVRDGLARLASGIAAITNSSTTAGRAHAPAAPNDSRSRA